MNFRIMPANKGHTMKLLRYEPRAREKPGMLDGQGKIRGLSDVAQDITPKLRRAAVPVNTRRVFLQGRRNNKPIELAAPQLTSS